MRNITFSAQEEAIEQARRVATQRHTTLNNLFREWLEDINRQVNDVGLSSKLETLWKRTNYLKVGGKLSRDEMNER
ncbi:MAG TPA: hypothetical protein VLF89_04785 [Candidatus Saccharimonadales bacterium]|nr:hypothetical protein [Candidatus Saccharimonadales bacterium]